MAVALRPIHTTTPVRPSTQRAHYRNSSNQPRAEHRVNELCPTAPARVPAGSADSPIPDSDLFGMRVRQAPEYRRRRFMAFVLVALALYATWSVLSFGMAQLVTPANAAEVPVVVEPTVHVVAPGETMWSIAVSLDTGRPIPAVVDDLAEANGGVALLPGQRLVIDAALD